MSYSRQVKLRHLFFVALAGGAMISMQMAGSHLHVGESSGDVGVHGTHLHDVDVNGHDHSTAIDVNLIDSGIVWSKVMAVLVTLFPTLLGIVWILHTLRPSPVRILPLSRRSRWRPPPRAPPLSS